MLKRITFTIIIKVVLSLFSFQLSSQTILIDPNFEGGFGMGSTFTENGWTVVNGNVANKWILDTVPGTTNFASNAAYISDNISGSTWNYLNSSTSVVHFYRDITFPAGEINIDLSFNWQCLGESGSYDALMVSIAPTSYTPTATNSSLATGGLAGPATTIAQFWASDSYNLANFKIPPAIIGNCTVQSTRRIILTWKNDSSLGAQPPIAIDNLSLTSTNPSFLEIPFCANFNFFNGSNISNLYSGWYEGTGTSIPILSNSPWDPQFGLGNSGNTSSKFSMLASNSTGWIISPPIEVNSNTKLIYNFAITEINSLLSDAMGMQGTDDKVNIKISTDCGSTWADLFTHDSTNTSNLTNIFQRNTISLSNFNGQQIQIAFYATDGSINNNNLYDFIVDEIKIENITNEAVDYGNLQFPPNGSIVFSNNLNVFGQTYEAGVTESPGAGTGIQAWVGLNKNNTNPENWIETSWKVANFNLQSGNNDEYIAQIGNGLSVGTHYYAFRYRLNDGIYKFGAYPNGFWNGNNQINGQLTIISPCTNPVILSTTPSTRCGIGTTTLSATSNNGIVHWFNSSTSTDILGTGNNFTTPEISQTTSFFAESRVLGPPIGNAGKVDYTTNDLFSSIESTEGLVFDVFTNMVINSVDVFLNSDQPSNMTVYLNDRFGNLINSKTFNLPQGNISSPIRHTLILDFLVPHGEGYRLSSSSNYNLVVDINESGFPFSIGNLGSIVSGHEWNLTNKYFYFYNWNVNSICTSSRSEIVAEVTNPPLLGISPNNINLCQNSYSSTVSITTPLSIYNNYQWIPSNGVSGTPEVGFIFEGIQSQNYQLYATQTGGQMCGNKVNLNLNVNPLPNILNISADPDTINACGSSSLIVELPNSFVDEYELLSSSGSYSPITGTNVSAAIGDDQFVDGLNIGFNFKYEGTNYTTFGISSNGFIRLGANNPSMFSEFVNMLSDRENTRIIAPLWDDNNTTGGSVQYSTTGSAGSKVLTVQFTNIHVGGIGSSTNPTISLQIKLFEGDNKIQFIYGNTSAALQTTTASIGLSGATSTFLSVTPNLPVNQSTYSTITENFNISSAINFPSGTIYSFTPKPYSYSWLPTDFLNNPTIFNPNATGVYTNTTYHLNVTDNNNCVSSDSLNITIALPYDDPLHTCASNSWFYQLPTISENGECNSEDFTTKYATQSLISSGSLTQFCDMNGGDDDVWIRFIPQTENTLISVNSNLPFAYQIIYDINYLFANQNNPEPSVKGCTSSANRTFQLIPNEIYYIRIYSLGTDTFLNFNLCIKDISIAPILCDQKLKVVDGSDISLNKNLFFEDGLGNPSVYNVIDNKFNLNAIDLSCLGTLWTNPSTHYIKADSTKQISISFANTAMSDTLLPLVVFGPFDSYPGDNFGACGGFNCSFTDPLLCYPNYRVGDTLQISVLAHKYYVFIYLNPSNLGGTIEFIVLNDSASINDSPITCFHFDAEACNSATNLYDISYRIFLNDLKPLTGYMIVKDDSGISKYYNAPFENIISDTLKGIFSDFQEHKLSIIFSDNLKFKNEIVYIAPDTCISDLANYFNPHFVVNPNAESGYTSGSMSVSDQGGMIYQIPIQLPPGTAGVKPNISVTYNSNGGDGIMGMGFSCDAMSFISRTGNTFDMDGWNLGVQLSQYDKLSINGERLIQTNAGATNGYLKSGANYITRNQTFTKYEAIGTVGEEPDYYIAYTKSGEKMYFGNSTDSKVVGITGITSFWLLKRVEDQYGNYFEYEYYNRIPNLSVQANEFYPTRIKYTGNNILAPYCFVDFVYTNRTSPLKPTENYNGGTLQINTKKLSEIKVFYLDTLIKKFVISYDSSSISKILRVRSIQEYGMNGKYFQPTTFNWDENEVISNFTEDNKLTLIPKSLCNNQAVNGSPAPASAGFTKYIQTDFNGDGLIDYCVYNIELDSVYIFLNQDGVFALSISDRIHQLFNAVMDDDVTAGNTLSSSQIYFEDMNGDNATDIVFIKHSTGLHRITYVEPSFDRSNISILQVEAPNIFTNVFGDIAGIDASIKQISFVDIDGNGLPEVFVYRPIDGVNWFYTRVVVPITLEVIYQKTNGPLVLAPGIPANTAHRFLDINGDGNAELLWAVRVNNQFVMKINKMLAPIQHYISDTDGLIQYGEVISRTFNFDNGDSTSIFNLNLFFTELNGDGLPDFVSLKSGILTFYINDGKFNFNQRGTLTIGSIDYPVFADLNSDGNFDILKLNFANGINSWLLNNGYISLNGNLNFIVDPGNNSLPSGAITGSTPRFLSYRKNSYVDVLFLIESTNIANQRGTNYWWINNFKPSYRVNEVTNGLGLKSKVLYTTTDNIEVYKPYLSDEGLLPPPVYYITNGNPIYELAKIKPFEYTGRMPVVYEYQLDNGFNGINKLTYKYQKSVMDRSGAGFRGFRRVIIKDETSGLITVKNHKLTKFGIMSDTFNYTMYSGDTFAINTTYSIDSIESKSFTNTSAYPGNVIVTHEYESYFQYNKLSEKKNYDLDGTFASQINSFNVVDSFGNVTMNVIDYNDGFVDSLLNQYTNNTALWHLGRLTRSELRRYAPNAPPIKRVSAFEYHPTKGAMVKEIVEPDLADTFRIEKNYLHDAFGNVFSERIRFKDDGVWKTRGNTTQFDIRGRFIVQQTNDLGHISKASYNNLFGHKKSVTDINGIISYTYFDDFGRIKRAEGADSSWTETMYRRCNGDCPPQAVTFTIETYANGRTDKSYFDKMGREVKSETLGFKGRTIFTQNKYNFSGRLISTSDPYYSGETPKFSTISYDKLGREILREETGGSISSKTYYGLGMKVVNPIGQTKTSYTFANGKVQQSIDNQGNELQFRYDAQGNTVKTILPTGHEVISEFNILNQQTKLIDPDLGTYIYRYNAIGEIKYQRDPKGNEVFMKYDTLGRLIERKELEDVSYFTYDSATNGIGMLAFKGNKMTPASSQYITHFTYQYDYLSRPVSTTYQAEGDSVTYTMTTEYDTLSRPVKLTYPTINGVQTRIRYTYDGLGYNDKIIDDITNVVYWSLDSINSQGQLTKYTLGNGNKVERMYDMEFDWINEIKTTTSSNQIVQHLQYDYDFLGNVQWRKDLKNNMQEYFSYDNLNRLTQAQVTGYNAIQMQYDILGNITSKSDLGIYHYNQNGEGPHVVSSIDLLPGKCIPSASTVFTMNSFNKATSITSTHHKMDLLYSVDKQRYRQQYYFNNQWVKQKDFILDLIEREKSSTGERTSFYIKGSEGVIAVKYHQLNNDSTFYHYWLKDNLGSLQTVIGSNDSIVEVLSFDAWGQRRFADGKPMQVGVLDTFTNDRGFTGHEHLDFFDLINMNGRIYDAILGRFTSPDPFVQESFNIQSYNRYAYVFNNPLAFTDPSGYWGIKSFTRPFKKMAKRVVSAVKNIAKGQISKGLKDLSQAAIYYGRGITGWDGTNELGVKSFGQENWNTIVVTAATIAATMALGPGGAAVGAGLSGALAAGAASGFVGGALGTILAGGDVGSALKAGLKGAAIGAVSAGLTYGVGSAAVGVAKNVNSFAGYAVKTAGDGVVSGAISEYQGGSFKDGFASGAISSEIMSAMSPLSGVLGSGKVGRSLMSAAISGTASDLSGGKFFNGAASGAMSVMFGPSAQKSEEELVKEALGEAVKNMMADMENPNRFKNEHGVDTRMAGTRENVDCAVAFGSIFLGAGSKIAGTAISMQYHLGSVVYDGVRGNNLSGVDQVMSIIGYFPGPGGAVSAAYFCGKAASDGLFGTLNK